jgi:type II secretion system protein G
MNRQKSGFTLIEMVIVIAIVGMLAALLIPVFLSSIQKAKQKGTMQDMNGIAKSIVDYITDVGYAPEQGGPVVVESVFVEKLTGFYVKAMPLADQWGTAFNVYCGTAIDSAGVGGVTATGPDDFLIVSYGRDKRQTPYSFDPANPETVYFGLTAMHCFDQDLIIWNGSWIHAPKGVQSGR